MAKQQEGALPVIEASKTSYSLLKAKQSTAQRIVQSMHEQGLLQQDDVLSLLADTYRLLEQMESQRTPLMQRYGTTTPLETLTAIVEADQAHWVEATITAHLHERWGATLEEVDALFEQAAALGDGNPVVSLQKQLDKRTHYQQGPIKRQESYQQMDVTTVSLEQLKAMRLPEATNERIHRAVQAIMAYNQAASHDLDRWFIRAKEIKELVGGRGELIGADLKEHRQEIALHHQVFCLTDKENTKPFAITDKIHLS